MSDHDKPSPATACSPDGSWPERSEDRVVGKKAVCQNRGGVYFYSRDSGSICIKKEALI